MGSDTHLVIPLAGDIDLESAPRAETEIRNRLGTAGPVAIDLSGVSFLDSAGVAVLNRLAGALHEQGRPFSVVAPPGSIARRVLEIVDLVIPIAGSSADVT